MKKLLLLSLMSVLITFSGDAFAYCGSCEAVVSNGPGGYSVGVSPFYPSMDLMEFYKTDILKFLLDSYRSFQH